MNLKLLGVAVLSSTALLTSCGYEFNYTRVLSHDEAVEWVKSNYGKDESSFVAPTSSSSEWALDGYLDEGKTVSDYNLFVNHITNFVAYNAHVDAASVDATKIDDDLLNFDEYGWITKSPKANSTPFTAQNFPKPIRSSNFDSILNFCAYYGVTKYNCDYIVDNAAKTLTINGTYGIYTEEYDEQTKTNGYNIIHVPYCSIKFNNKGCLEYIKFDINDNAKVRYNWYNESKTKWSGTLSGVFLKGSYMHFNFNY